MNRRDYVAALILFPTLVGCSGVHFLNHKDLRSKYRITISLVTEAETFLNHLNQHIYSDHFVKGHLSYLQRQNLGVEDEIANASANIDDTTRLNTLKQATGELARVLGQDQASSDSTMRSLTLTQLHSIRQHLEADMPR